MDFENIRYELRPPIAVVTLDRPKVLNALNQQQYERSWNKRFWRSRRTHAEVRVRCCLREPGEKAFVAGADIRELASRSLRRRESGWRRAGRRIFNLIENCGKPVIACINGYRAGGRMRIGAGLHPAHRSQ